LIIASVVPPVAIRSSTIITFCPGVISVIQSPEGLKLAIDGLTDLIGDTEFDVVVGPESRTECYYNIFRQEIILLISKISKHSFQYLSCLLSGIS